MAQLPIENLLRKPVEGFSALAYGGLAVGVAAWPNAFYVQPGVAWVSASGLIGIAAWRAYQTGRLLRYQARLRNPPFYSMGSADLPVSTSSLFLGKGFRWSKKHTARGRRQLS